MPLPLLLMKLSQRRRLSFRRHPRLRWMSVSQSREKMLLRLPKSKLKLSLMKVLKMRVQRRRILLWRMRRSRRRLPQLLIMN